jgi:hypothetical protein
MPAKQGIPLAFNLAILARPILVHFGFYHLVQINQGDGIGKRSVGMGVGMYRIRLDRMRGRR